MLVLDTRVRVAIPEVKRASWAADSFSSLQGKLGTITEVKNDVSGHQRMLVTFDEPAATWWKWQTPPTAWWFDADELQPEIPS